MAHESGSSQKIAIFDQFEEFLDIHTDRAAIHALGLLALEAAGSLELSQLGGETQIDFVKILGPFLSGAFGHFLAFDSQALFGSYTIGG